MNASNSGSGRVLGPAVAGSWYPAGAESLASTLDELYAAGAVQPTAGTERIRAVVAPHAGFVYSGRVAASAFGALRGTTWRRVLAIGPSHYAGFKGAAVPDAAHYRTPLGLVPIDVDAIRALTGIASMRLDNRPFEPEHCLEAEIPFLQTSLAGPFSLLPVLIGGGSGSDDVREVATALAPLVDRDTLVVVSSDFTHFGPHFGYVPFRTEVPERIRDLDRAAIACIEAGDVDGFVRHLDQTGATVCGRRAIETAMRVLPTGARARLVAYDTSGRMTGDWGHSVSYASLLFLEAECASTPC